MRSAPALNSWMTPFSSVAMIEKLALFRIAFCSANAAVPAVNGQASGKGTAPMLASRRRRLRAVTHRHRERLDQRCAAGSVCWHTERGGQLPQAARVPSSSTIKGNKMKTIRNAVIAATLVVLAGCSGMSHQEKGTATGAVIGGVAGNVLGGG